MIFDPLHYLALLEHKSHALDQAAPLAGWAGCRKEFGENTADRWKHGWANAAGASMYRCCGFGDLLSGRSCRSGPPGIAFSGDSPSMR